MHQSELTQDDAELLRKTIETSDRLYVEGVHEVAAAVRTSAGLVFCAIHLELRADWANVCGEVAALCCMVAAGHPDLDTVAAVWRDPHGRHFLLPPCGRCREVINEFNRDAWVIVTSAADPWAEGSIESPCKVRARELLPLSA